MRLEDGKLRPIQEKDLEKVLEWRNSERIRESMFSDHLISEEEHRTWFEGLKNEDKICMIFEFMGRPVGVVNFTDIDSDNNKCYWGFYLGETSTLKGTGMLMGYQALEFAFNDLNIRKLCSQAFAYNTLSIGFHKNLGFIEEGRLSKHIKKNGVYEDIIVLALFQDIWAWRREEVARFILTC